MKRAAESEVEMWNVLWFAAGVCLTVWCAANGASWWIVALSVVLDACALYVAVKSLSK